MRPELTCDAEVLKSKGRPHTLLLPHLHLTAACSLCVLQVHKTTLHAGGSLEELTFFPR